MIDNEKYLEKVGSQLRILRLKNYKSAEVFATKNGLNHNSYYRWESGKNISLKSLLKIISIHGVTPKQFFELIENRINNQKKNNEQQNSPSACKYARNELAIQKRT